MREDYGFLPDLSHFVRCNARRVLGDYPLAEYFNSPSTLAFHDLTPGGTIPRAARKVVGLGNKFVPTPTAATSKKTAMESYEELEKNFGWKVIFAGEDEFECKKSKMCLKSKN